MFRKLLSALTVSAAVFLCVNCGGSAPPTTQPKIGAPDPQWVTVVSLHSNGAISRHSPVRVLFTTDVIPEARVGGEASANITITPTVKAHAIFASRREIVLRPDTEFAPGTDYRVSISAKDLVGVPQNARPFDFDVQTLGVNFDVKTWGLGVDSERNELMVLSGAVLTADSENREHIEKILTATLNGKPVAILELPASRGV